MLRLYAHLRTIASVGEYRFVCVGLEVSRAYISPQL